MGKMKTEPPISDSFIEFGGALSRIDNMHELMRTMYGDFCVNRIKVNEEFIKNVTNEYKEIRKILLNSPLERQKDSSIAFLDNIFEPYRPLEYKGQ